MMKQALLSANDLITEFKTPGGLAVIDMGLYNRAAWEGGKALLAQLIRNEGEVQVGDLDLEGLRLPTIDLFMDNPAHLAVPEIRETADGTYYDFPEFKMTFGVFSGMPAEPVVAEDTEFLIAAKSGSLMEAIFQIYLTNAQGIAYWTSAFGKDNVVWGWSSQIIPNLCDDPQVMKTRMMTSREQGSLISLWVRDDSDETIQTLIKAADRRGEIRIQNLVTGNTFSYGSIKQ